MKSMKIKVSFIIILISFIGLQFFPVNRDNPPVEADLVASERVKSILKKSCYDCHSNETNYPFYSYVFPISVILQNHIEEGRQELNFSNWEKLSISKKASKASDILEEIESNEMPLFSYTLFHKNAKLSPEELQILKKWTEEVEDKNEPRN